MKISCQSCAAKYTIADEKVVGKVIKLKCKKCSSTIVVNGNDPGVVAQLQQGDAGGVDDAATQLMSQQHAQAYGAESANPDEWTVSVTDDDQRTMTTAQILNEYAKGALTHDTYVWRDGMGDWAPLLDVPELAQLLHQASQEATAVAPAPAAVHHNGNGHGHAAPMAAAAAAAVTPSPGVSAARRAGAKGGGVDLFGGGGLQQETRGAPAPTAPSDKHIGERNETSVLFSLKDLAAAEASAAKPAPKADPFNPRKNDRVDDIFSLGGGMAASPMLAPPPLMAPIIEPPPPPPPPPSVYPPSHMMVASAQFAPPQKSSPIPFIVGGVGVLALVGGIIFFVAGGSGDKDKDKTDASKQATTQESKPEDTSKPADTSTADTSKPVDTTAPTDPLASASAPPTDPTSTAPRDPRVALTDPKKDDPKKDDPKKDDPKKEDPKEEPPAAGGGGDAPFDRGAASAALGSAAGSAKGCKKADGPTGSTKVQVTFAPSGKATQAVVGAPFAGTSVGSCIASAFKGARVPPFSGAPMTVSKTVNIK